MVAPNNGTTNLTKCQEPTEMKHSVDDDEYCTQIPKVYNVCRYTVTAEGTVVSCYTMLIPCKGLQCVWAHSHC